MKRNKIYISGKITGMEAEAFKLFKEAETMLIEAGYNVINPMGLEHDHDKTWESYMLECLEAMDECDTIYLLDNWTHSKGAKVELKKAIENDFTIWTETSFKKHNKKYFNIF